LATLRRIAFVFLLIAFMLLAAMFAYSNPQPIDLDLGFVKLEQLPAAAAFGAVFAAGWLFGLLSAGLALLRNAGEKRRLRRDLRYAEAELSSLRGAPLQDAN
jgi:uncharacterized integral membrane protein